jgi:hypothetical protein
VLPWAWRPSQVLRGPEEVWKALGEAEASGGVEAGRVGLKDGERVKAGWPVERDKTLSRSCLVQKSKNFVSRARNTTREQHQSDVRRPTLCVKAETPTIVELRHTLLVRVLHNQQTADRLIAFERERDPLATEREWILSAIDRLERDNR